MKSSFSVVGHSERSCMTIRRLSSLSLFIFLLSACAWQRIPAMPEYARTTPIPIKVGVILADDPVTSAYGPSIVKEWQEIRLFDSLIYPYRDGDAVAAVMRLNITGGWKGSGAGAGFVTGLTLGIAGTAVGPSMTGTHDAAAVLNKSAEEIGRYSIQSITKVEWGMAANTNEVAVKADTIQKKRIAYELAKKIDADRQILLSKLGK